MIIKDLGRWAELIIREMQRSEYPPSFAIAVYKEYRGKGFGTALMKEMLAILKMRGYEQASLSVQKENFAVEMYRKLGFQIIGENEEEYLMLKKLND